jgi:hypothetical protein
MLDSERRRDMKQWFAIVAAVAFFALPVMVSVADDDISIPPDANWSPTPPTPAHLLGSELRVVSTAQEQASDVSGPAAVPPSGGPLALTEQDAYYQRINFSTKD